MNFKLVRFGILIGSVAALMLVLRLPQAQAAPPALNCTAANAAITAPQAGVALNGLVQIEGTASLGGVFQYYKLEVAANGTENYTVIGGLVRQQVVNGQLGVWDSASVPDGTYSIRLRVVDTTGNYCEVLASGLQVQNSSPPTPTSADTPTPAQTEVTPSSAVVPTAAPTIQIPGATEPASAPAETPAAATSATRTPGGISFLPGGFSTDSITGPLGDILNSFARAFLFGVMAMAGILLVVGVIFYVRRVL
jgi:hypothetical protein